MMTAKKAAKKKPATKKAGVKTWTWTLNDNETFTPDPLDGIKNGDHIKVVCNPASSCFDIKVTIKKAPCGGGGGPIIIHS